MVKKIFLSSVLLSIIILLATFLFSYSKASQLSFDFDRQYFLIKDKNTKIAFLTDREDPRQIVKEAGFPLYEEDRVNSFLSPEWGWGGQITVKRATPIYLKVGNQEEKLVRTWAKDVEDLLKEQKVTLGKKDKVNQKLSGRVKSLMTVKVDRLGYRTEKETQTIPYQSVERPDPDLLQGRTRLGQAGEKGKKELTYRVKVKNGKEIDRELTEEKIIEEPVDRIVYYGTKPPVISTRYGDINISYIGTCSTLYDTGDKLRITNPRNGETTTVIVDHGCPNCGPFDGPIIDLEVSGFRQIESLWRGVIRSAKVEHLAK